MSSTTHTDGIMQQEPAACFGPFTLPPGRTTNWPTLVVECSWSESLAHIQWDANLWIGRCAAEAKAVISMSMTKGRDALVVEKGTPGNPPQTRSWSRFSASREQSVRIFRYGNGAVWPAGGPLMIRFEEIFLPSPNSPSSRTLSLTKRHLSPSQNAHGIEQSRTMATDMACHFLSSRLVLRGLHIMRREVPLCWLKTEFYAGITILLNSLEYP